jgi:hypothetical protein
MSTYQVSSEHINGIVAFLSSERNWDVAGILARTLGCELKTKSSRANFGQALWNLNKSAVGSRNKLVGANHDSEAPAFKYQKQIPSDDVVVCVAIDELLYQCSEGDIPQSNDLYKTMNNIRTTLAMRIVHDIYETGRHGRRTA